MYMVECREFYMDYLILTSKHAYDGMWEKQALH